MKPRHIRSPYNKHFFDPHPFFDRKTIINNLLKKLSCEKGADKGDKFLNYLLWDIKFFENALRKLNSLE
jgi:hypothetical protein